MAKPNHSTLHLTRFWSSSFLVVFVFACLRLSLFLVVFVCGCLRLWSFSFVVVFVFGRLRFLSSSFLDVLVFGRLSFWSSSILVVHSCVLMIYFGHLGWIQLFLFTWFCSKFVNSFDTQRSGVFDQNKKWKRAGVYDQRVGVYDEDRDQEFMHKKLLVQVCFAT